MSRIKDITELPKLIEHMVRTFGVFAVSYSIFCFGLNQQSAYAIFEALGVLYIFYVLAKGFALVTHIIAN